MPKGKVIQMKERKECAKPDCDSYVEYDAPEHHRYCVLHAPTIDTHCYTPEGDNTFPVCRVRGCDNMVSAPHRHYCDDCYIPRYEKKATKQLAKDVKKLIEDL